MLKINTPMSKLPGSYLFADIAKRVNEFSAKNPDKKLIRLGIGDVTQPLAPAVVNAMTKAVQEMGNKNTFHGYPPAFGYDFLINAIIANDYKSRGVDISPDEVFVSDGAKSDSGNIQELFSSEERIAVTDPVYPVYVDSNAMAGRAGVYSNGMWGQLCYLPVTAENDFVPELPDRHVDVIYLCYPNNPTGTTLTNDQLKPFVDYAIKHGSLIIYDAAYKAFINTPNVPRSIYEIEGAKSCAIECCSFSKTAGFTGVRCAYTIVPKEVFGVDDNIKKVSLRDLWARRQSTKFNGVSYIVQRGAEAVFSPDGKKQCQTTINYYMKNATLIREELKKAGYTVFGGVDAPYVWLKTPNNISGWDFFDLLLKKAQVVGTPGEGFGPSGAGYFRLTAFNTYEATQEALAKILAI
ncbi:MAG: LL-diaminopimelate aminotransferase [Christensenellaceae bacterium]|nr:LL-diaminopimelate aminotransferase [Christensenellaceae bacterium]